MTAAQIMAILSLLMAFGVDQSTIKNVEAILQPVPIVRSATINSMDTQPKKEFKVIGSMEDGTVVYQGTRPFIYDEKGCMRTVQPLGDGLYGKPGQPTWCPPKQ